MTAEGKTYTQVRSTLLLSSIQMLNQVIRDLTKRPLPAAAVRDRFKSAPVHSQGRRIFPSQTKLLPCT